MNLLDSQELKQLEKLEELLSSWGVGWVLADAYGLRLQGYNVKKRKHINALVDNSKLDWIAKATHEAFPPRGSTYLDDYFNFIEKAAPLHLIPYTPSQLKGIFFTYELPNKKKIKVGKPAESVKVFGEEIKQHDIEELGEDKIKEWLEKIEYWKEIAKEQKDKEFEERCEETILGVKAYFNL